MNLLIKNGIIDNKKNDILIENGIIKDIKPDIDLKDIKIIDANSYTIIPGLVDMHCHICEPGFESKENIQTVSLAAAHGGYTSITCEPDTNPSIDNKTILSFIMNKLNSSINIYPYGSMTKNCDCKTISEMGNMIINGAVGISDGGYYIEDTSLLNNIFNYLKMFKVPVIIHCKSNLFDGVVNEGVVSTTLGVKGIPKEAEIISVLKSIVLAQKSKIKLHISGITTKESVHIIKLAKQNGINITADTSPHYFTLTEEDTIGYNTLAKINPPLRTKEDIKAIIEGLKDGTIDVISSGHTPTTIEVKQLEFDNADFGISSIETAFSISYTNLVKNNILTLQQLIQKMSCNPSKILQLNKGKLEIGSDADIVIVDLNNEYKIDSNLFMSKAKFSPYQSQTVIGKVIHTIVKGNQIFSEG